MLASAIDRRLFVTGLGAALAGCAPRVETAANDEVLVRMTCGEGDILLRLHARQAPVTVGNFLRYVDAGLYARASFYRTVRPAGDVNPTPINVIQGGLGAPSAHFEPIPVETTSVTGLSHVDGTISMARQAPGWPVADATSEFFICLGDNRALDYGGARNLDGLGFAAFGHVAEGMDVVRRIHAMPTGPGGEGTNWRGQMLAAPVAITAAARLGAG